MWFDPARFLYRATVLSVALMTIGANASCDGTNDPDASVMTGADTTPDTAQISEGVIGRITSDDGRALAGALVTPMSLDDAGPPIPEIAIISQDDGSYEWPLPPGDYELVATLSGYQQDAKRVRVESDRVVTLDFTLTEE